MRVRVGRWFCAMGSAIRARAAQRCLIAAASLAVLWFGPVVSATEVGELVASQISETSYRHYLDDVLYTHDGASRSRFGAEHDLARDNIVATFESFGLSVELDPFEYDGATYYNVIATQIGTVAPDAYYVIGAHYDSVGNPGADDDASGVAGVLEIARVLSTYETAYSIKYMAFDLEEVGLRGSRAYVEEHSTDDIRGMIQLDMIAWDWGEHTCKVSNSVSSFDVWRSAVGAALEEYSVGLTAEAGQELAGTSDHAPFLDAGYQACAISEDRWSWNPCYHETCDSVDTPDYIDYELGTDITRGVAGFLADNARVLLPIDCDTGEGCGLGEFGDADCNANGVWDDCDIACGTSEDINANGVPDECEPRQTLYVDLANCPSEGTGTEADPFCRIQDALNAAENGDDEIVEIIIADGVYTGEGNRNLGFSGKALILRSEGGAERCTIDCEAETRAFVFGYGTTRASVVDGFTLTNGYSAGNGGAIYCAQKCSPTIRNCVFKNNVTTKMGGAVYCRQASPVFSNCLFEGNVAWMNGGAIASSWESHPLIEHCVMLDNIAWQGGGAVSCMDDSGGPDGWVTITNSILYGNRPSETHNGSHPPLVHHSCVAGGWPGTGNIGGDPGFVFPGDYHLRADSPCVDAGTNGSLSGWSEYDLDGNQRPVDGDGDGVATVDIGMCEFDPDAARIAVSARDLELTVPWNGESPEPTLLQIRSGGGQVLNWQIAEDCPWLGVSPMSGSSAGEVNDVLLSAEAAGLTPGESYETVLAVSSADAVESPLEVRVTLHVSTVRRVPSEYPNIRAAIEACVDHDTVLVADGVYTGNENCGLNPGGLAITVRSENGADHCIIDGEGSESWGIHFNSGEDHDSRVQGFTIRNTNSSGVSCLNSSPTIADCVIVRCGCGVGCSSSDAVIENCLIEDNAKPAGSGGGVYLGWSTATIKDCRIRNNLAGEEGGGVYCMRGSPMISGCVISNNMAESGGGIGLYHNNGGAQVIGCDIKDNLATRYGGGVYSIQDAVICDCRFEGNVGGEGGGLMFHDSDPVISHCIFWGNVSKFGGGAVSGSDCPDASLANCVLWGNTPDEIIEYGLGPALSYCDVRGGYEGEGNIDVDPQFAFAGDHHLLAGSPCIDAGADGVPGGVLRYGRVCTLDGDGDGIAIPDMGTHEHAFGVPEIALSRTSVRVLASEAGGNPAAEIIRIRNSGTGVLAWEAIEDCPWLYVDPAEGSCTSEIAEFAIHFDASGLSLGLHRAEIQVRDVADSSHTRSIEILLHVHRTLRVPSEYATIQAAVDACETRDEVLVADGVYTGPGNRDIEVTGKSITIRSENGPENCIIDCEGVGRGFYFHDGVFGLACLRGFTIRNGHATSASAGGAHGGAVLCGSMISLMIEDCRLMDSVADGMGGGAGCQGFGNVTMTECRFLRNTSVTQGGGLAFGGCVSLRDCLFAENAVSGEPGDGGAIACYGIAPSIEGCRVANNPASGFGGGIYAEGYFAMTHCEILNNSAGSHGGGLYDDTGSTGCKIAACTFAGNVAGGEGACMRLARYRVAIVDSILWSESEQGIYQPAGSANITYCNVSGGWAGEGNIDADPLFVDPDGPDNDPATWEDNDYRLRAGSPCIDAGSNLAVPPDGFDLDDDGDTNERIPFDLAGLARFIDDPMTPDTGLADPPAYSAIVDMGAYEFQALPNDCNYNGIPDDEDIASGYSEDCDGNGIPDECELCGDLNDDGSVDYDDYVIFLAAFGGVVDGAPPEDACCDADDSGDIGMADFAAWLACYRDFVGDPLAEAPTAPTDPMDEGFSGRKKGDARTDYKAHRRVPRAADVTGVGAGRTSPADMTGNHIEAETCGTTAGIRGR